MITPGDMERSKDAAIAQVMVAVRFNKDDDMLIGIKKLADEHQLSMNMAVKMLLGYAFNEIERSGKKFVSKVVFESE